jgi:hypothetical protein
MIPTWVGPVDWLRELTDKTRDLCHSVSFNAQNLLVSRDARLEEVSAYIEQTMGNKQIRFFIRKKIVETRTFVSHLVGSDLEVYIDGNQFPINLTLFRTSTPLASTPSFGLDSFVKPMTVYKAAEKLMFDAATSILRHCVQQRDKFIYHLRIDNNDIVLSERATIQDLTTTLQQTLGSVEEPASFFDVSETHVGIRILINGERAWGGERISDLFWGSLVIVVDDREFVATKRCFLPYRVVTFRPNTIPIEIKSIFGGATLSLLHIHDMTISELKQRIYQDTRVPPSAQSLVYKGYQLEDHLTLSSYNVNSYDVIYMVRKLRGGGRHFSTCSEDKCGCTSHIAFVGCCAVCRRLCKCKECQNVAPPELQKQAEIVGQYYCKLNSATHECTDKDKEDALFR